LKAGRGEDRWNMKLVLTKAVGIEIGVSFEAALPTSFEFGEASGM